MSHGDGNVTATRVHSPPGPDAKEGKTRGTAGYRPEDSWAALARRPNAARRTLASEEMVPGIVLLPGANDEGVRNIFSESPSPHPHRGWVTIFPGKGPAPRVAYWPV